MKKVSEVCRIAGVTPRTLHYYDKIGLLKPSAVSGSGYRLYSDEDIKRLMDIMFFKELSFGLDEIKEIINSPNFKREKAIEDQINLLKLKKEHIEEIISLAERIREKGEYEMDFKAFDKSKEEEYAKQAKIRWGSSGAYKEYTAKTADYTPEKKSALAEDMMDIFREFAALRSQEADSETVSDKVIKLQKFITANFYTCTDEILSGLGGIYNEEGEMKENIDKACGEGTAEFVSKAIAEYCGKR